MKRTPFRSLHLSVLFPLMIFFTIQLRKPLGKHRFQVSLMLAVAVKRKF